MKKLLIVGGDKQPIPPINGGAVENLTQMFIDSNEIYENFKITVVSCYTENILNETFKGNNVEYKFVKKGKENKILNYFNLIINKIFRKNIIFKTNYVKNLIKLIKREEFDYILIENYVNAVIPLSKAFPNKKIILHLHNDKINKNTILGKKIVKACYKIITVSDYINRRVNTINNINPDKVYTIINSIYVDKFGKKDINKIESIKSKLKIEDKDLIILFVGRIAKTKGVKELLKAFNNLSDENVKLVIAGNSWYGNAEFKDKYQEELKKYTEPIKDRVIFTGYIDYNSMPDYYDIADIIVIPSIWQEPCSLTLFETMASRVPLITTNTGGTPEVVKDFAIKLDVDDDFIKKLTISIKLLIDNPAKRKEMADNAYEYVQKFNPKRYYDEITNIIEM